MNKCRYILCMCKVASGHLLSIDTFYSVQLSVSRQRRPRPDSTSLQSALGLQCLKANFHFVGLIYLSRNRSKQEQIIEIIIKINKFVILTREYIFHIKSTSYNDFTPYAEVTCHFPSFTTNIFCKKEKKKKASCMDL